MLIPPSEMSLLANIVSIRRDIAYILTRPAEKARPKGAIYEEDVDARDDSMRCATRAFWSKAP